jgi:ABC-type amino acid transport substrate-binding protein
MKAFVVLILCSLTISVGASARDNPVPIYGTNWGMTLEIDDTGFYNDVIFMALRGLEGQAEYSVQPYVRALRSFADDPGSCIYSQSIELLNDLEMMDDVGELIETRSVVDYSGHIFWAKTSEPITSKEQLRGKTIGQLLGADYDDLFADLGVKPMVVNTETQKTKLLFTKRVDGIIGFIPDIYMVFKAYGFQAQPFSPDFVLMRSGNSVVCRKTPATELLIAALTEHITQLQDLGVIDRLLRDEGVPDEVIELVRPRSK